MIAVLTLLLMKSTHLFGSLSVVLWLGGSLSAREDHFQISGIYPHLAMYNEERECGSGGVVPWAGRLGVIT